MAVDSVDATAAKHNAAEALALVGAVNTSGLADAPPCSAAGASAAAAPGCVSLQACATFRLRLAHS